MMEKAETTAVFVEETGEVKCGYCGKTFFIYIRKRQKGAKIKDIIIKKCNRCKKLNALEV